MKVRVRSCGGNAKSEGFRLVVFVNKNENKYYFLDIYPKTGPLHKSNMKQTERKECLIELSVEKKNGTLIKINFNPNKKEMFM